MTDNAVYVKHFEVRDYEVDLQGIVNNANYLHYFEHTRNSYLRDRGFDFADLHRRGIDLVLSACNISFRQPLRPSDTFDCLVRIKKKGIRFVFYQTIVRNSDNALCASCETTVVSLVNGRPADNEEITQAFAADIASFE